MTDTPDRTFTLDGTIADRVERLALAAGLTPAEMVDWLVRQGVDPDAVAPVGMPNVGGNRRLRAGGVPLRVDVPGACAARLVVAAASRNVGVSHVAAYVVVGAPQRVVELAADRAAAVRDAEAAAERSKSVDAARLALDAVERRVRRGGTTPDRASDSPSVAVGDPAPRTLGTEVDMVRRSEEDE